MKHSRLITAVAALAVAALAFTRPVTAHPAPNRDKPNVVLIIVDDLGHADIGAQDIHPEVKTPNIDSLAADGVRFTNAYVSCPVCSPTRAGLMSGQYQQRFGFEQNPARGAHANFGYPADQPMLPELFKNAGYTTGMVGKWHLGSNEGMQPNRRGFDEFFGFRGGAHRYIKNNDPKSDPNAIMRNDQPVGEPEYLTDAFNREAVAFVERHRRDPFFLYLAYNAPHSPRQATEKYLARFPDETDPARKTMFAMMAAVDDGVGQLLAKLREHHLEDNTLIVFLSDNGGPLGNGTRNTPFRGRKGETLEGGIRVPFLLQWKSRLPAGRVDDRTIIQLDLFPTLLAAIGATPPADHKLDGVNLLPFLTDPKQTTATIHETLYWRFGPRRAIRSANWKLQWNDPDQPRLYDLSKDPAESTDLSPANPDVTNRLLTTYKAWDAQLMTPRWPGKLEGPGSDDDSEDATPTPKTNRPQRQK
jgi:arylsulfatase A-like enzyme